MARWTWFLATFVALGALGVTPAAAQEEEAAGAEGQNEDEARMHFRLGRAYYDSGRFLEAANEFEQAAEMSNRPQLYYNIFLAYRDAGDLANAIHALETFLERVPDAPERPQLEARLASMRRLQEQTGGAGDPRNADSETDADADSATDTDADADSGTAPDAGDDAGSGTAPDADALGAQSADDGSGGTWMPGWIIAAGGGALALAGVVTGVMALGRQSDLEERCVMDGDRYLCDDAALADADGGKTLALTTDILLVTGGVALAAGVITALLLGDDGDEDDPDVTVAADRHGAHLSLRGTF